MSIEVYINGKEIFRVKSSWSASSGVNVERQFHDLSRIAHHALDKAFKNLSTVDMLVETKGGDK